MTSRGPAITNRLQSDGTALVPSSDSGSFLMQFCCENGGKFEITHHLVAAVNLVFTVALEEIGLERPGAGDVQQGPA